MAGPGFSADILAIDDDSERRGIYAAVLGDLAARVVALPSEDGARRLSEQPFGLVILRLDGMACEPASMLGGIAADTPILLVSAGAPDFGVIERAGPGTFDFLAAPMVPELLRNKARLLLDLCGWRAEALAQRRAAIELRDLVAEQIHRGKNLLAIVQSITLRTINDGQDPRQARTALVGRLRALAKVYDLLSTASPKGALLADIVEVELGEIADRVSAAGPAVRLTGTFAQTFALAVHELATNATRHGALCADGGTVAVGWTLFDTGADRYLEVGWTERGGPPATAAPRRGFGLTLISSLSPTTEAPNFSFDGDGFACRLRLPREIVSGA